MKECILNSAPKSCDHDPGLSKHLINVLIIFSLLLLIYATILQHLTSICNASNQILSHLFSKNMCHNRKYLKKYWPIANLRFIAKIIEKLVLSQFFFNTNSFKILNWFQSSYRPGHSTGTALLKNVNDPFKFINKGNMSLLALLGFYSAFDTF